MDKRAVIVCLVLGVAACQPALKPDTGYPVDWPAMTVLAPGFAELAGTFANEGTATIAHQPAALDGQRLRRSVWRLSLECSARGHRGDHQHRHPGCGGGR